MLAHRPNFKRWFLLTGLFGLMIAGAILIKGRFGAPLYGALFLWPTGIVGLSDPETLSGKVGVITLMFGGQFLLYGLVGLTAAALMHVASLVKNGHRKS